MKIIILCILIILFVSLCTDKNDSEPLYKSDYEPSSTMITAELQKYAEKLADSTEKNIFNPHTYKTEVAYASYGINFQTSDPNLM